MQEKDDSQKIGKAMTWVAWIIGLLLLVWFFQTKLDADWNPNQQPKVAVNTSGQQQVVLERNRYGHYVTAGFINQENALFMLDTGATSVSIPMEIADKYGLERQGSHRVQTANGSVMVYATTIDELSIGNINLYNVRANINPGMTGQEILLGMSALKQLEFSQKGKYLHLTVPGNY
ncbi:retropepsin-like aspartic protease family protein [Thalassotalea mangrovi]|uniref:TIGR02281 family clan AA aspartic protease n=1 Tax=Thalassotalea mangrovi TaxID=2572245 RepID=A0A4U1B8Q0_9GAMM|nr:TIGR02281 family clan AA aspartic protease [Thalassotalea mangrovi]TKB47069.1 TIGR02281 family clan AA aspartic protease [Thalassotalea mangrovi]